MVDKAALSQFPIHENLPTAFDAPLPKETEVVVIGAGIVGVMAARDLTRQGVPVVLLEKGRVGGEQSSRNWGWIRAQGRDFDEIPIVLESQRIWKEVAQGLDVDIGLREVGVTYLATTPEKVQWYEDWLSEASRHGLSSRMLSSKETSEFLPNAAKSWEGAIHTPTDLKAEPWLAVPAIARSAVADGLVIKENCAVRGLDMEGGRITGVITEAGRIACKTVILAGGAWSSLFLRRHGVSIPQLAVRSSIVATEPVADVHSGAAADSSLAFRRRADGGYSLAPGGASELFVGPDAFRALPYYLSQLKADPFGVRLMPKAPHGFPDAWTTSRRWADDEQTPFERTRVLNPKPNTSRLKKMMGTFEALFPSLGPVKVKAAWAGMIDAMPDIVPIVDHCPDIPGLVIATGMSGHGFGIGPAFGRIAAALAVGGDPGHDLTRFRFERFRDGSPMNVGPAI